MNQAAIIRFGQMAIVGAFVFLLGVSAARARDAAFVAPGSNGNTEGDAVRVEPKGDIDTGESTLNVARRTTLFFVNQTDKPVQVENVTVNNDGNVTAQITNDDCSKQATIPPLSRCSVEVSVTPTSPGPWSVETLLTHDGTGRIARAKLSGKTGGAASGDKKDTGLSLSTKETNPINFGDVEVGEGKAVRSALMINDSPDPITLYSIEVIGADNGLERLDQGCAVDMELKPGESCPVTLMWTPTAHGQISTDLIIRHSGRLGFAVIPIRGAAKGGAMEAGGKNGSADSLASADKHAPPAPSAADLEKALPAKMDSVPASALAGGSSATATSSARLRLIGTVGTRAVLLLPDGTTSVVNAGEQIDMDDKKLKVLLVDAKSADILIDGKKKKLPLESSPELIAKAPTPGPEREISGTTVGTMGMASSTPVVGPSLLGASAAAPGSSPPGGSASGGPAGTSTSLPSTPSTGMTGH